MHNHSKNYTKSLNLELEEKVARRLFIHLDIDNDGLISRKDINIVLNELSIPSSTRLIDQIHRDLDINQDGIININDFMSFYTKRQSILHKLFETFELDRKKSLDSSEIEASLLKINIHASKSQINELIKLMEKKDDKIITFEEFRNFILLLPIENIQSFFNYWTKASSIDLGESMVVPDETSIDKTGTPAWITLFSGGVAGAISRTTTAPLDRIKIILQAQTNSKLKFSTGMKYIYETGGWRGFFQGNGTNVLKICPETATKFFAYERFKRLICKDLKKPKAIERLMSGGLAGIVSQFLIYPLEITKTRLALAPKGYYKGIFDCINTIKKNEGFFSLYKGLTASLIGIIPYASIDLAVYNILRDHYTDKYLIEPNPLVLLGCGAVSSICGQVVSYPLALIRTRLQSQGMPGMKIKYYGILDCAWKIVIYEGAKGFYKGILPNFMKSVPAISISYVVFENMKKKLMEKVKNKNV